MMSQNDTLHRISNTGVSILSQIYLNFIHCLYVIFLLCSINFVSYFILTLLTHTVIAYCFIIFCYILCNCYVFSIPYILYVI